MINQVGAAFNECSAEIKRMIISNPDVNAETLTGWLLQNLQEKTSKVKYKQFTQSTGGQPEIADWEWWFVFSDQASFTVRIQAIKLDPSSDNDPNLMSDLDGQLQMEQQVERNVKDGFAPMYVIYSTNDHNSSICKNGKTNDGIFWVEADKFRKEFFSNGQRSLSSTDILTFSNPVSCILCCPGIYGEGIDIEQGFRQHIRHYFPHISENGNAAFRYTPQYIIDLLECDSLTDDWEMQNQISQGRSKGILAVDLRKTGERM